MYDKSENIYNFMVKWNKKHTFVENESVFWSN